MGEDAYHTARLVAGEGRTKRMSRSLTIPTRHPSCRTGRCQTLCCGMRVWASCTDRLGGIVTGDTDITSRTRNGNTCAATGARGVLTALSSSHSAWIMEDLLYVYQALYRQFFRVTHITGHKVALYRDGA